MSTMNKSEILTTITPEEWARELTAFDDATVYQTVAHGVVRSGESNVQRFVMIDNGNVVAMAQVRIATIPFTPMRIAYVGWGPLWRRKGNGTSLSHLDQMLGALHDEFAVRQKKYLRVFPNVLTRDPLAAGIRDLFAARGFRHRHRPDRTLVVDLKPSIEEIRAGLRKGWRHDLVVAEKAGLRVTGGTSGNLIDQALVLYREMHDRKGFPEFIDAADYRRIQVLLDDQSKMRIMVCSIGDDPIAAIIYCLIGDTGLTLMAATGELALKNRASYLLWWRMLCDLKQRGAQWCDLGGISPEHNPGGYVFKSGIAHSPESDVEYLGQFEACSALATRVAVTAGDWARTQVKQTVARTRALLAPKSPG